MRNLIFAVAVIALSCATPVQAQIARDTVQPGRLDAGPTKPKPKPGAFVSPAKTKMAPLAAASGPIATIQVRGSHLPASAIDVAVKPFIGAPIDATRLQALADAVAKAYVRSDIALYSILVPEQTFAAGEVLIVVIENSIDEVVLSGQNASKATVTRSYAGEMAKERPLTRTTLERNLLLMNDLPGVSTTSRVLDGQRPDTVKLLLARTHKPVETVLSIDTHGSSQLGRTQLRGDVLLNGWGFEGNQTRLTIAGASDLEKFLSASVGQSATFGPGGLLLSGSFGWFRTQPAGTGTKGEGYAAGLQASYPLIRSSKLNVAMGGGIDGVNSDNAAFGQVSSSDRTRVLRGALSASGANGALAWEASGSVSHGLDAFGARVSNPGSATLAFTKANLQAGASLPLGPAWRFSAGLAAQLTSDALPASELMTLGGVRFGRAFAGDAVSGDSGFGVSLEMAHPLSGVFTGSEVYGVIDGGMVRINDRPLAAGGSVDLASAGVGVRVNVNRETLLSIEASNAIDVINDGDARNWRLALGLRSAF